MSLAARVVLFALLLVGTPPAGQDCKECKCTKYPVEPKCEKCCPVVRGTVKAVTPKTLTVSLSTGGEETLNFSSETVVKGQPRENANVLAVYNRETRNLGYVQFEN